MTADVLLRLDGAVGRITLNRPKTLHALTTAMCAAMIEALLAWRDDTAVQAIILDHAGERGFCAGGDIRMLQESGAGDGAAAREFFRTEYRLNHLLFTYPKPTVAVMDGIVMGGGVGLSLPCRWRVATERTVFAMPETGIGLFPDVGGGWFLPRLPGETGVWLALTGARIKAADCLALGIANAFLRSEHVEALKAAIVARSQEIETVLTDFEGDAGEPTLGPEREHLDRLFKGDRVEAIADALGADDSEWARAQGHVIAQKSPQTLKVALRQLRTGATLESFADNMAMEFRLGSRIVHTHDFQEGVRAVIVDKDGAPRWSPDTLAGVSDAELDRLFAPLPAGEEWSPLS